MMLGWGLRGHIGGGPFGAMIPGAMVALSLGMLLRLPASYTSVLVVFGVFGIGLGGEMTYGQTLGFLRNPDTAWWGLAGTTLKGSVWGILGGTVLALGFVYKRMSRKSILVGFLIMLLGFLIGYKLINDPMVLYFSDPNNPRSESWAALLFGSLALLIYLKSVLEKQEFSIIRRFGLYGLIGGGLGFGLGSLWMVLGSHLSNALFQDWWKAMEFSFGFLLGGALGLAAFKSMTAILALITTESPSSIGQPSSYVNELVLVAILALLIHAIIPYSLEPILETRSSQGGFMTEFLLDIVRLVTGYEFYGLILVLVLMRFPGMGWQIGITLTFAHAAIDLVRDFYPHRNIWSPFTMHFFWIALLTSAVALLAAYYRRRTNTVTNMFLILIWSCIAVSLLRLLLISESLSLSGMSFSEIIFARFFVDLYFIICAVILTVVINRFRYLDASNFRASTMNHQII